MVCFCKIDLASHIFVLWGTVHIIRFVGLQLDENQQMRDTPLPTGTKNKLRDSVLLNMGTCTKYKSIQRSDHKFYMGKLASIAQWG